MAAAGVRDKGAEVAGDNDHDRGAADSYREGDGDGDGGGYEYVGDGEEWEEMGDEWVGEVGGDYSRFLSAS